MKIAVTLLSLAAVLLFSCQKEVLFADEMPEALGAPVQMCC
jgi:hypothetical protein